jgi:hypothetical protein
VIETMIVIYDILAMPLAMLALFKIVITGIFGE